MNIHTPIRKNACAGMTLVEMLVSLLIGMTLLASVGTLIVFTAKSFVALGNYNDLDQASRNALDILSSEIRQTKALTSYSSAANAAQLTFKDQDDATLSYEWDKNSRTLVRKVNGIQTKVLLQQCDALSFGVSQRNPSNNFEFYPATGPATAKLVDVSWTCSRQMFQIKVNTESVQTAKIVLRN